MSNKPNVVDADETFGTMMVSAVRYALGRQTYIVSTTTNYIKFIAPQLDNRSLACIERDIRTANNYGHETIDKPEWMRLLLVLQDEMKKRNLKPW